MKKFLTVLGISMMAAVAAQAQGYVAFNNNTATRVSTNKVENGTANNGLAFGGSTYYYALYVSTTSTAVNGQAAAIAGRTNLNYVFTDSSWTLAAYATNLTGGIFSSANADSSGRTPVPGVAGGTSANFVVIGWSANIGTTAPAVQSWFNSGAPLTDGWIGQSMVSGAIAPGSSTATTLFASNVVGLIHGFVLGKVPGNGGTPVAPSISVQPANKSITNGGTVSFTTTYAGTPTPTFQWFCNSTNIPGQTGDTLTLHNVTVADSGNSYFVTLTNSAGSVTSSNGVLTVTTIANVAPSIINQPVNRAVTNGQSTTFSVTWAGSPIPVFQWFCNGTNMPGQNSSQLILNNISLDSSGNIYFVTLTNSSGSVTSSNGVLTVTSDPVTVAPFITVQPGNKTITNGQSTTFKITYGGAPEPTFQWFCNGTNIPNQTSNTLVLNNVTPGDSGNSYFVTLTNIAGSVASSNGILTVVGGSGGVAPFITSQPPNKTVTNGLSATFSVACGGTPTPTFQWFCNGTNIPGKTSASLILSSVTLADSGNIYFVTLTNSSGSVTSSNGVLTVVAGPTPVAPFITVQPADKSVIYGQSASFSVAYGGTPTPAFQWLCNGTNIPGKTGSVLALNNVTLNDSGNSYSVVLTNSSGSVTSSNGVLTVTAPAANIIFGNNSSVTTTKISTNSAVDGAATGLTAGSGALYRYALYVSTNATSVNGQTAAILGGDSADYAFTDGNWSLVDYGTNISMPGRFLSLDGSSNGLVAVPYATGQATARFVVIGWSANIGTDVTAVGSWFNGGNPAFDGWIGQSAVSGSVTLGGLLFSTNAPYLQGFTLGLVSPSLGKTYSVTVTPVLILKAAVNGQNLQLTWPVAAGSYGVISASSPGGPWNDAGVSVTDDGTTATATVPVTGDQQFFRLQAQ